MMQTPKEQGLFAMIVGLQTRSVRSGRRWKDQPPMRRMRTWIEKAFPERDEEKKIGEF
jgi:hypothetical protein